MHQEVPAQPHVRSLQHPHGAVQQEEAEQPALSVGLQQRPPTSAASDPADEHAAPARTGSPTPPGCQGHRGHDLR